MSKHRMGLSRKAKMQLTGAVLSVGVIFSAGIAGRISQDASAAAVPVDYRVTVWNNPDPDGGCRVVVLDDQPLIGRSPFDCPGGQKISNMAVGDVVYADGNPVTDGRYTVLRVAFTELGDRPVFGQNIDLSFMTSYAGQRYWVLTGR